MTCDLSWKIYLKHKEQIIQILIMIKTPKLSICKVYDKVFRYYNIILT